MASTEPGCALLDVNVLIALHDEQHIHHEAAALWFLADATAGWATCPLTQNGCVRIMSQPGYPNAIGVGEAVAMLQHSCSHPKHRFWADDVSLLDAKRFAHGRVHGHRQLTDLYLLALAVRHGGRLVTFDGQIPMSAVHGAAARHLVCI
ncbi:MAG TPA: TA system VapC family ribonuclease toxin [Burkholderiaceae bacterium]|nr:TA system VapC family ribonuclease toxin [Burkholderiaceae bacterium]